LPRQRRKAARPAELIEAGLAEFALNGFAGTRLEDVARRAGVSKGTIYRYFADKEALFLAAVQSRATPVREQIESFVDSFPGSTRELMGLVLALMYREMIDRDLKTLMRIIIGEGGRFPALAELYHREMIVKGRALLARILARGIARGEVRESAATALPIVVMGPAIMAAVWKMTFDALDPVPTESFMRAHLDLLEGVLVTP
jgi:AcrR family transcriptional regulator